MAERKFKKVKRVKPKGSSITIPKKYTNKSKGQSKRMADEIKKYKGTKDDSAYFAWSGDTNSKTGKPHKTKESSATKAYKRKYG